MVAGEWEPEAHGCKGLLRKNGAVRHLASSKHPDHELLLAGTPRRRIVRQLLGIEHGVVVAIIRNISTVPWGREQRNSVDRLKPSTTSRRYG